MPDTMLPGAKRAPGERPVSDRCRRLAEAGVRVPSGTAAPLRFAGTRRPRLLAALIRLFS